MAVASKKKIFDDRYEILSIVGRGSRSVVYHARNIVDGGSEVALKVLIENKRDKLSNAEKLRREALAMVSSHHPHVIRLDDFHTVGEISYLSMEYAPESDLRKYIARNGGNLSAAQAEEFLVQVAEGLEYIHRVGIIHRDIKPDNILVSTPHSVRIGDFGVALLPGDTSAPQDLQNAVGTMDYMAPEVLEGKDYNQRSDIYSLGVSFYEMIAGKHPFAGVTLANQLDARKTENIPTLQSLRSDIPEYVSEALMRALAYDQKDRFQTAKELVQHLRQKRVVKNPSAVTKKEERTPPQLRVIPGNQTSEINEPSPEKVVAVEIPDTQPLEPLTPLAPEVAATEAQATQVVTTEEAAVVEQVLEQQPVETTQNTEASPPPPEPILEVEKPEILQINPHQPEAIAEADASTAQISEQRDNAPMQATSGSAENSPLLRDSRASRTPTVFISPDTAEKIRKDSSTSRPKDKRKTAPISAPKRQSYSLGLIALGVVSALLLWKFAFSGVRGDEEAGIQADSSDSGSSVIVGELNFPNLPAGVYSGSVTGLVPAVPLQMTAVSQPKSGQLALFVGIDGWKPVILSVKDDSPASLRVVSNGFIVELTGRVEDGIIKGTLKNVVNGTSGVFLLRPISALS